MRLTYKNQLRTLQSLALAGVIGVMSSCGSDDNGPGVMPAPVVSSFSPDNGFEGETITINGSNFSTTASENTVTFSGSANATVSSATSTSLEVAVPAAAVSGPVSVTVEGQTGTSNSDFTVYERSTPVKTLTEDSNYSVVYNLSYQNNLQWGYEFTANVSGEINKIAVNNPAAQNLSVYIWSVENETLLDSVSIQATEGFQYTALSSPISIEATKKYRAVVYIPTPENVSVITDITFPLSTASITFDQALTGSNQDAAIYPTVTNTSLGRLFGMIDFEITSVK